MDIRKVSISDSEQEQEPAPQGVFSFAEKLAMSKVDKHIGVNMKTVPRCRRPGGSVRKAVVPGVLGALGAPQLHHGRLLTSLCPYLENRLFFHKLHSLNNKPYMPF